MGGEALIPLVDVRGVAFPEGEHLYRILISCKAPTKKGNVMLEEGRVNTPLPGKGFSGFGEKGWGGQIQTVSRCLF